MTREHEAADSGSDAETAARRPDADTAARRSEFDGTWAADADGDERLETGGDRGTGTETGSATGTGTETETETGTGLPSVLRSTGARLRDDPFLWLPFAVAGIILLAADRLRATDSLPTAPGPSETTVTIPYTIYPTGTTTTTRPLESLVDLRAPMLAYGLGLEVLALVVVAGAGWLAMTRAGGISYRLDRFGAYVALVVGIDLLFRAVDAAGLEYTGGSLLVALVLLGLVAFVAVRLFLVPVCVVTGPGLVQSIPASWRRSRGRSWTILGLILLFGFGSQALVRVPHVGTALAVTVVGSLHAVSLVVLTADS